MKIVTRTTRSVFLPFKKHVGTIVKSVDSLKLTVDSQQPNNKKAY